MTENLGIGKLYEEDICEISTTIKQLLTQVIKKDRINLPSMKMSKYSIKNISEIFLTGSGQSFYVAESMAHNMELLTDLPTYALPSALLKGTRGVLYRDALVIAISQSGESFDTISAIKRAEHNGAKTIAVTSRDSALAGQCKNKVYLADDTTSLCTFQNEYLALAILGIHLGSSLGCMSKINMSVALKLAQMLPGKLSYAPTSKKELQQVSEYIKKFSNIIICGYSTDEAIANAVAEKFRLITNLPVFTLPVYDVPTSCLDLSNMLVIPIISNNATAPMAIQYINKIKEACNEVIIYTTKSIAQECELYDGTVTVEDSIPLLNPITLATVMQQTILEIGNGIAIDKTA